MRKLLFIGMLLVSMTARAEYNEIIEVLKYVETLNDPKAIGDSGDSFGVLQVQRACVDDVNRYFGTDYQHEDMFNPICAEEVTSLYMKMGEELYYKRYGVCPTEEVLVRNHNGGIYQGYRIKATKKYYRKYLHWKAKLEEERKLTVNFE